MIAGMPRCAYPAAAAVACPARFGHPQAHENPRDPHRRDRPPAGQPCPGAAGDRRCGAGDRAPERPAARPGAHAVGDHPGDGRGDRPLALRAHRPAADRALRRQVRPGLHAPPRWQDPHRGEPADQHAADPARCLHPRGGARVPGDPEGPAAGARVHRPGAHGRRHHQRHRGPRPRRHRRARGPAGHGGQGGAVCRDGRHQRRAHPAEGARPGARVRRRCSPSRAPSARSSWRTSPPRSASRSSRPCARGWTSPCCTTTSTAPRWWPSPR